MTQPRDGKEILLLDGSETAASPLESLFTQMPGMWKRHSAEQLDTLLATLPVTPVKLIVWHCEDVTLATTASLGLLKHACPTLDIVLIIPEQSLEQQPELVTAGARVVLPIDWVIQHPSRIRSMIAGIIQGRTQNETRARFSGAEQGFLQGAARVAHDFNSPLTAMRNSFDLVDAKVGEENPALSRGLTLLNRSLEHAFELMNRWGDVVYKPAEETELIDLEQELKLVLQVLQVKPEIVGIRTNAGMASSPMEGAEEHIQLSIGRFALQQILFQVIRNSWESVANDPNGRIEIEITGEGDQIAVVVDDNGRPVRDELTTTLWKDFVTDKPGHFGLGLGVTRYLLMLYGGSIRLVESKLGGAAFRIQLRKSPPPQFVF